MESSWSFCKIWVYSHILWKEVVATILLGLISLDIWAVDILHNLTAPSGPSHQERILGAIHWLSLHVWQVYAAKKGFWKPQNYWLDVSKWIVFSCSNGNFLEVGKLRFNSKAEIKKSQLSGLPKTNSEFTPENGWLEDEISYWDRLFSGDMLVSGKGGVCKSSSFQHVQWTLGHLTWINLKVRLVVRS